MYHQKLRKGDRIMKVSEAINLMFKFAKIIILLIMLFLELIHKYQY